MRLGRTEKRWGRGGGKDGNSEKLLFWLLWETRNVERAHPPIFILSLRVFPFFSLVRKGAEWIYVSRVVPVPAVSLNLSYLFRHRQVCGRRVVFSFFYIHFILCSRHFFLERPFAPPYIVVHHHHPPPLRFLFPSGRGLPVAVTCGCTSVCVCVCLGV